MVNENALNESALAQYRQESVRPLACVVFVAPVLLAYEAGVLWLGPQALRNGVDVWLRQFLHFIGFGQYFLLPILTCGILLSWHHAARFPWRVRSTVLGGMLLESMILGFALMCFARWQQHWFEGPTRASVSASEISKVSQCIAFLGAGIYEELLFRLMLLPVAIGTLHALGLTGTLRIATAIALTSTLFSLAHYDVFSASGEPFAMATFCFRLLAGVFFSCLFLFRGFGVAVGTHALYDLYVTLA